MRCFVLIAALLQVVLGGHVAVRLPYLNPAGVTYVDGPSAPHAAPLSYAPGPVFENAPEPVQYGAPVQYAAPIQYAAPLQYAAPAIPAKVEAHHVGYAAAPVPAVAAVPFVKHVPTVSQVPVTRYEAQHALIEKQLDVVKPAVSTRKFEVRRPAIQKQFYDIEERVIIRPAGSALVELDEPTSKLQRGPAVIRPLANAAPLSIAAPIAEGHHVVAHAPVHVTAAPIISHSPVVHATPAPFLISSSTPISTGVSSAPPSNFENESVVVENADFRNAASLKQQERYSQDSIQNFRAATKLASEPQVESHSNGAAPLEAAARLAAHDPAPALVPSLRFSPEDNRNNQHKLIELLTARGGVAEIGFGREGSASPVGDAGHVRARVLSATPAPEYAEAAGERVSTRRVVVSRPIETLQEFDVVEPATKIERVSIQEPTLIKTAHLDHVQVHGSVPVVGKALTQTVAHAAVPIYQKTISPAFDVYHH